jgi:hypothetical protein
LTVAAKVESASICFLTRPIADDTPLVLLKRKISAISSRSQIDWQITRRDTDTSLLMHDITPVYPKMATNQCDNPF